MVHSCWRLVVAVMAVGWTNAFVHFHSSLSLFRPSTLPQHKTTTTTTSSRLQVGGLESLFPSLGNLGSQQDDTNNQDDDDGAFEATPLGLIRQARRMVASDFGILDPSLLADDNQFVWIGPYVDEPLGKLDYIAAGRFFDLRAAFPDLEYRPHDFRIDESNPWTIRVTCRVTGTMRGALRLRDGTLPPTGKRWLGPPETISMTFTPLGKVQKLCTGFCMDRQVGNTKGSTGVLAAALVAGQALSDWDLYPAPAVWNRFFGRPIPPLLESKSVLAPFPETVMIQLAKGILATTLASQDPSLLSDDQFEFWTPYVGPVNKASFLENYAVQEFESVDPAFSHFRVDPYDPVRVWVDVVPTGPGYQGCPQAMSFVLDEEGFCTRITSSYVLDPSVGNGGGLGGPEGYRYATGQATLDVWTRPWSRVVGRVRKQVLSPLTGVGVDDYVTSTQARSGASKEGDDQSRATAKPPPTPPSQLPPPSAVVTNTAAVSASERLSGLRAAAGMAVPPPPPTTKKLKQQGAQEAATLKAQLEAAQARALQARAQLAALVQDSTTKPKAAAAPKAPSPPPSLPTMAPETQLQQQQQAAAAQQQQQQQQAAAEQRRAQLQAEREAAAAARQEELQAKRQEAQRKRQAFLESVAQVKQADAQKLAQERATKVQAQKAAAAARQEQVQAQKAQAERQRVAAAAAKKQQLEEQKAQAARQRVAAAAAKKQQLEDQKAEAERKRAAAAAAKKQQLEEQKAEAARKRAAAAAAKKLQLEEQKAEAARKRAAAAETQRAALAAKRKLAATQKAVEAKQKQRQALKAKSAAAAAAKKSTVEQDDSEARRARQRAALESLSNAVQRATISLFGVVGFGDDDESSSASSVSSSSRSIPISSGSIRIPKPATAPKPVKKAAAKPMAPPKGVPVLKRWRKTPTGAVTGIISGSRNFEDGDRVTTSPITTGTIAPGQLVRTGSGSRYFLS